MTMFDDQQITHPGMPEEHPVWVVVWYHWAYGTLSFSDSEELLDMFGFGGRHAVSKTQINMR